MPCKRNRYHFLKNWFIHIWRLFGDDYYSSGYLKFCNPYANSVNTFATWIFSSRLNMNYHYNSKNNNNYFLTFLYLSLLKWGPLNNRGIVQKLKRKYNENKNKRTMKFRAGNKYKVILDSVALPSRQSMILSILLEIETHERWL